MNLSNPDAALHTCDGMMTHILNHGPWAINVNTGEFCQIMNVSKTRINVSGFKLYEFGEFHRNFCLQKDIRYPGQKEIKMTTRDRAMKCVTHHEGCACREYRLERMETALELILARCSQAKSERDTAELCTAALSCLKAETNIDI